MEYKIGVIGLGYVGLPLAVSFSKHFKTTGFDIKKSRIEQILNGNDVTNEISNSDLVLAIKNGFEVSDNIKDLLSCNVYIVTVPTPIDQDKNPDLSLVSNASELISSILKKGDFVIYESTVYPGATEEICIPIIQKSGLKLNQDFFVGFSPERINPGDKEHTFEKIDKVVSGSNDYALEVITDLYKKVIKANIHQVSSIKVAEAAKIIENTQRDLNIAFVNELAQIFNKMDIDTTEVLEAASTKWNFLNFKPGLVGGHCIGVDPYYLAHKALKVGYSPDIILSGRKTNEAIPDFIFQKVKSSLKDKRIEPIDVIILGATFKENCPDIRNSKSEDLFEIFIKNNFNCKIHDPQADPTEMKNKYGDNYITKLDSVYDVIIVAVGHDEYLRLNIESLSNPDGIVFDVKSIFPKAKGYLRL
jgi:UDP-N-acetyl-D-galactosamine dehydrogenase